MFAKKYFPHILLLSLYPLSLFCQTYIIQGFVKDAQEGFPLPKAKIIVKQEQRPITTVYTDTNGFYQVKLKTKGNYLLEAQALGYEPQIRMVILKRDTVQVHFGLLILSCSLKEVEITATTHSWENHYQMDFQQLQTLSVLTTAEALDRFPGISMARAGSWGIKPVVQGMSDGHLLVFIDGIRVTQACPMGMDACTATLDPDMIEAIAVSTGTQDASYGSGNLGGVIQVQTAPSYFQYIKRLHYNARAKLQYQTVSNATTATSAFQIGNYRWDASMKIGWTKQNNYKIPDTTRFSLFPEKELPYTHFQSRYFIYNTHFRPRADHQISLIYQYYEGQNIGWPGRQLKIKTLIPTERRQLFGVNYQIKNRLEVALGYQPMFHDMENLLDSIRYYGLSYSNNYQVAVQTFWKFRSHHITVGVNGWLWQLHALRKEETPTYVKDFSPILNKGQLWEGGLFVLDLWQLHPAWQLKWGLRWNTWFYNALPAEQSIIKEDFSQQRSLWSGNIEVRYQPSRRWHIKGILAKGFHTGTPVTFFISAPMLDGFYHVGNPSLLPEVQYSKRIQGFFMQGRGQGGIELFHNTMQNEIEWAVDTSLVAPIVGLRGVKRAINIPKAQRMGFQMWYAYALRSWLQASINVTYTYGETQQGRPLPNIPPLELNAGLRIEKKRWQTTIEMQAAAAQPRFAPEFGEIYTPSYAIVNVSFQYQVTPWIQLFVRINNLTNRYYRRHLSISQLPEPGFNGIAGIIVSLDPSKFRKKPSKTIILKVDGMVCEFCAKTLQKRLEHLPDVFQAIPYIHQQEIHLLTTKHPDMEMILKTVHNAGFEVKQ